jgi:hypothetical protein
LSSQSSNFLVELLILITKDILVMFDLFDLGLGGFDEGSLVVDD